VALTDNADLYIAVHEHGINTIVLHVMRQRPSWFNRGSPWTAADPVNRLRHPITASKVVLDRGNPLLEVQPPIALPGTDNRYALEYGLQITAVGVDLPPGGALALPAQLAPQPPQSVVLRVAASLGLGCPGDEPLPPPGPPEPVVLPPAHGQLMWLDLDMYAQASIDVVGAAGQQALSVEVQRIEIVDLSERRCCV
jgi:hypothetical protein